MPPPNKGTPTVRRILKEAKEMSQPDKDIFAAPIDDNLFEWHFIIRGPPSSAYEEGYYHGRINLPSNYPLAPPSFRFLQDSGRFDVNREICLSISNFHAEEWLPAWGIRTALVALRSFMATDANGAVGSIDGVPDETKREIARKSREFKCSTCSGKRNDELLCATTEGGSTKEPQLEASIVYKSVGQQSGDKSTDKSKVAAAKQGEAQGNGSAIFSAQQIQHTSRGTCRHKLVVIISVLVAIWAVISLL
ncbi:ubiquitin-conjugating enzyme/RWD-like protein [Lipomyces tetrasporus]|uniref:Ubiquitin-conjugating enzyme/RWD-like protein n=1 Tax=Lipomyces tetrasporus TaxID=54092 RepID=A0AAD7QLJ4_9ASCO|nr:ubiquitin-conjugating enzyme/RWD-like protein [Lipomyces tetrasporus]KAJ8097364.1 ubiquitin-conjugating enzyme/RWD-like protein [Lipomyces tetrasporus]